MNTIIFYSLMLLITAQKFQALLRGAPVQTFKQIARSARTTLVAKCTALEDSFAQENILNSRIHHLADISASEVTICYHLYSDRIQTEGGRVIILEATSESQEALVNAALQNNDESEGSPNEDPYGAVLWPSAKLVGSTVLQKYSRDEIEKIKIVELGAGTGLVSITCALAGCKHVVATDFNPLPLQMLEKAASLNGIAKNVITTQLFDVKATESQRIPKCDLLLVADMLYDPATARAVAKRVAEAVENGSSVIVGDSPNRPGRSHFIATLRDLLPQRNIEFAEVKGESVVGVRHDLISDERSVDPEKSRELNMGLLELLG